MHVASEIEDLLCGGFIYFVIQNDTLLFKSTDFLEVFERSLFCSPGLHLFDQKYSKSQIIIIII